MNDNKLNQTTCSVTAICRNGEWFWRLLETEKVTESSIAYTTEDKAIEAGRKLGEILGILPQNQKNKIVLQWKTTDSDLYGSISTNYKLFNFLEDAILFYRKQLKRRDKSDRALPKTGKYILWDGISRYDHQIDGWLSV